jgi:ATP-dependent Lon protease
MEEDLPEEIRKELKIHLASNLDDVLAIAFPTLAKALLPAGSPKPDTTPQPGAQLQ